MDLKNAGIYVRVSTERQVQEGYSISAQKENLTNFAKGHDFKVYDIYADEGISGKNIEGRPDVKRLIKDIKDMSKIHSHISLIFSSLLCGRPFYGMSFGYWGCDEIDFEESN